MQDIGTLDGTMSTAVAVSGSLIAGSVGSFGAEHALAAYVEPTTATERYVKQVYLDLLGRSPDAGGAAYWAHLVDSGVARSTVAWAIVSGHEYHVRMVDGVYRQLLHRGVDGQGGAYWGTLLDHGYAIESLTAFIMGSPEYYAHAGGTPNGFVSAMFQDVLHRAPDAGGRAYFVQLLQQGVSHSAVAGAITWSAEAIGSRVNGYYQALLGRNADTSGRNYWVYLIGHGHRDEEIVALLVGSDEYFRRV